MCSLYLGENLISGNKPINLGVRNIGEIVPSSIPLTDAGLHLLDGSLILGGGIYQGFVDYIADLYTDNPSANYFTTEANWQTAVTTYGVCGKFVYDSTNNTVRLPKITGKIEGTTDVTALGDLVEQFVRLPNITGRPGIRNNSSAYYSGAYYISNNTTGAYSDTSTYTGNNAVSFDASRCSSVYSGDGSNTKIHEQAIKVFYYIVIANSTKTDIQVDIDEIATDLNGKADVDLTNCTDAANIKMAKASMPSDKYINLTLGASGAVYTAPANGWFTIYKEAGNPGFKPYLSLVNTSSGYLSFETRPGENGSIALRLSIPAKKGDVIRIDYDAIGITRTFRFIYAQGSESEAS